MKSNVWVIPYSVSGHCCFSNSFLVFKEPVTEGEAKALVANHGSYRIAFETIDMGPEEEKSLLQAMRAQT